MMRAQTLNLALLFLLLTTGCSSHAATIELPRFGGDYADSECYGDDGTHYFDCLSWRLAVEARNIDFRTIHANCVDYVGDYILHGQYQNDSRTICEEAYVYARDYVPKNDPKNIFIFDIDETLLSNLPFLQEYNYGGIPLTRGEFYDWIRRGKARVLPESLILYYGIRWAGIKPVILTERSEELREITLKNLRDVGYACWHKIIFMPKDTTLNTIEDVIKFKSGEREKLVKEGYTIVGNIGHQWSDLDGKVQALRSFKLPNPMYLLPLPTKSSNVIP